MPALNLRFVTLILNLMLLALFSVEAAGYKHKSEAQIAAMTQAQRVDEWAEEWSHHPHDVLDPQKDLLRKYVLIDGLKALPRLKEIMDEYGPTKFKEGNGRGGVRYDASWQMLGYLDSWVVRLSSAEDGRKALDSLAQSLERMRAAGYGQKDQHDWSQHGRFESIIDEFGHLRGINFKGDQFSRPNY